MSPLFPCGKKRWGGNDDVKIWFIDDNGAPIVFPAAGIDFTFKNQPFKFLVEGINSCAFEVTAIFTKKLVSASTAISLQGVLVKAAKGPAVKPLQDKENAMIDPPFDIVQRWVGAASTMNGVDPAGFRPYEFKSFLFVSMNNGDYSVRWDVIDVLGNVVNQDVAQIENPASEIGSAWFKLPNMEKPERSDEREFNIGVINTGRFRFFEAGRYRVRFTFSPKKGEARTRDTEPFRVVSTRIISIYDDNDIDGMLIDTQDDNDDLPERYGILAHMICSSEEHTAPNRELTDIWTLDGAGVFFKRKDGSHTLNFGNLINITSSKVQNQERTHVDITFPDEFNEGDRSLERTANSGLFFTDCDVKLHVGANNVDTYAWSIIESFSKEVDGINFNLNVHWQSPASLRQVFQPAQGIRTKNLPGHIEPFHFIAVDMDIASPHGDPTRSPAGDENANDSNEIVFDDQSANEPAGQCVFTMEANDMAGLSAAAQSWVSERLLWAEVPDVGNVPATYSPQNREAVQVRVTYGSMPTRYDDFGGERQVELQVRGKPWHWFNNVEFFFHKTGTSASGANSNDPNWFLYWTQAAEANGFGPMVEIRYINIDRDPVVGMFMYETVGDGQPLRTWIEMYQNSGSGRMVRYIRFLHHENGHVQYMQEPHAQGGFGPDMIWTLASDSDRDIIADEFEESEDGVDAGFTIDDTQIAQDQDDQRKEDLEHANDGLCAENERAVTNFNNNNNLEEDNWADDSDNHNH